MDQFRSFFELREHEPIPIKLRVLIVAEHASLQFGGEAALPLHYFRVLRQRGIPVWLVTHSRTRHELSKLYPDDNFIRYIEDTPFHRAMWRFGLLLPDRLAYFTVGFASRFSTQLHQRRVVRELVVRERIDLVHQPMPVSPREPSMMFGFGVPVVIGPMNGGMSYPAGFGRKDGPVTDALLRVGRLCAVALNWLIPGKRKAAMLLVANERTRKALPSGLCRNVIELVENGVDLSLWRSVPAVSSGGQAALATTFVFAGRLISLKAVDLLLHAFQRAAKLAPMRLVVIGDGDERERLEALAVELDISASVAASGRVFFAGWLPQAACASSLQTADCLVLPSLLECGGAVVLEAMAMGKPVIAAAWGGPLDYLDNTCGVLVEPRDRVQFIAGIADALVHLASNPPERARLGRNGRAKVLEHYDWETKVDRMLALFEEVAASQALQQGSKSGDTAETIKPQREDSNDASTDSAAPTSASTSAFLL